MIARKMEDGREEEGSMEEKDKRKNRWKDIKIHLPQFPRPTIE